MALSSLSRLSFGAAFALAACSQAEVILPGERESVLPATGFISVDAQAALDGSGLPEATILADARHPGLTGAHSGGHLRYAGTLQRRWEARIAGAPDETVELPQPIIIDDQVLAIGADAVITAFDLETGEERWRRAIDVLEDDPLPGVVGGVASNGDVLIAHAAQRRLEALSAETGELLWAVSHEQPLRGGPTLTDQNSAIVTDIDGRIYVYRLNDGELLWQRAGLPINTIVFGVSAPAAAGDKIVLAGAAGEVAIHDAVSGNLVWADSLASFNPRTPLEELGDIRAHPVVRDGVAYIISQSGRMVAYQLNSGLSVWEQSVGGIEMPWLAGETLFVVTLDGRLYALRLSDGAARWVAELDGALPLGQIAANDLPRYVGPIVADGLVYVLSSTGQLYGYDAETGTQKVNSNLGGRITTAPQIAQNVMVILQTSGRLTVLD